VEGARFTGLFVSNPDDGVIAALRRAVGGETQIQ